MPEVVHLLERTGRGPLWGTESEDLNATLLAWPPHEGNPEHVNPERDVLVLVVGGGGTLEVDDEQHELAPGDAVLIPKGTRRMLRAGADGIRYVAVHRRRGGLQVRRVGR